MMSKERELLARALIALEDAHLNIDKYQDEDARLSVMEQIKEILAQHEQNKEGDFYMSTEQEKLVNCSIELEQYIEKLVNCNIELEHYIEKPPSYDMRIHDNPDAKAWTIFFRETNPNCNVSNETMFGWFANAMMAMHDYTYKNISRPKSEPLSVDKILTLSKCHTDRLNFARAIENEHGI